MRLAVRLDAFCGRLLAGLAQAVGLRPAAGFGDGFGEVGEEERSQQDDEDDEVVPQRTLRSVARDGDVDQQRQHDESDGLDGEHDRVADHFAGGEFDERFAEAPA